MKLQETAKLMMLSSTATAEETDGLGIKTKVGFVVGFALGFVFMQAMVFLGGEADFRQLFTDPSSAAAKQVNPLGQAFEASLRNIQDAANGTTKNTSRVATTDALAKPQEEQPAMTADSLFQLPFYIYDNELDWSVNATVTRGTNQAELLNQSGFLGYKHSDDYWLLLHAKQHPMRTMDPSKADLFFVPTLLSAWNAHGYEGDASKNKFCAHNGICNQKLLERAEQVLQESKWYRRSQGRDHIVVDTHWRKHWNKLPYSRLLNCNSISFENLVPTDGNPKGHQIPTGGRVHIPTLYVGRQCQDETNKTHDFAMIATFKPGNKNFLDRAHICQWLEQNNHQQNYTVSRCGGGDMCPALGQARFGFHARGDTWGSNRLMDTFLSGAIPIMTSPEQRKILPDFLPWEDVSYMVDLSNSTSFDTFIQSILQKTPQELAEKRANISRHRDIFQTKSKGRQFDLYMHKFAQMLELY
ncbi:exostosin family domain containing protein, expressed [Seminavis robusta]|uniref:Exostosin family domain containing protein, expressed n=1 Tax=Seminavis robusta TaxID=568900 RepID=A0A9N8H7S2_9STRA|nr:exostosin family domain containing protein, expressed [Seminavis robusta]|eukprot:Sro213_g088520.1 exostosin family domain containing protein, expressed (470) ;mRNA; f:60617-62026